MMKSCRNCEKSGYCLSYREMYYAMDYAYYNVIEKWDDIKVKQDFRDEVLKVVGKYCREWSVK